MGWREAMSGGVCSEKLVNKNAFKNKTRTPLYFHNPKYIHPSKEFAKKQEPPLNFQLLCINVQKFK
jgi:hypothetical protein